MKMKSQGVHKCEKCGKRCPYDRFENRADSPIKCLCCNAVYTPTHHRLRDSIHSKKDFELMKKHLMKR